MQKIVIFGGDGFIGWPLALRLKSIGHEVVIVDDFSRRSLDEMLGISSLTPIQTPEIRSEHSGIKFIKMDVSADFDGVQNIISKEMPDTCVHFAQQRSAPVSMHNGYLRNYTISRNNSSTLNILEAIRKVNTKIHLLHMGTMGVYGYSDGVSISEGYSSDNSLEKMNPGSIYHLTKCHDQLTFQFYKKLYGINITDLHQGIVWGSQTKETAIDPILVNRFDYDSYYGTVLNRFLVQYAMGYPLTVYGTGNQTRSFINIEDAVWSCVNAITVQPNADKVFIANQFTEVFSINDISHTILNLGLNPNGGQSENISNPRVEDDNLEYSPKNNLWKSKIGTRTPTLISSKEDITSEYGIIKEYESRFTESSIMPRSIWI